MEHFYYLDHCITVVMAYTDRILIYTSCELSYLLHIIIVLDVYSTKKKYFGVDIQYKRLTFVVLHCFLFIYSSTWSAFVPAQAVGLNNPPGVLDWDGIKSLSVEPHG